MKRLPVLIGSLAAVVALTAMVGAGSAAAATSVPCSTAPESHICPAKYAPGTSFKAKAVGTVTMKLGFANIHCESSELGGEYISSDQIKMNNVSFSLCGNLSVTTVHLGQFVTEWLPGTHNGTARDLSTEIQIISGSIKCTYSPFRSMTLQGGNPAQLVASGESMVRTAGSFLCANPAKLEATYEVVSPNPLYIEKE